MEAEKAKHYEIGVIVGRFQIHELHEAHRMVIETVINNHKKVLLFLGVSPAIGTTRNPLDFASRQAMIQAEYPGIVIVPLPDQRSDILWSKTLDSRVREAFPNGNALLYGSRDSFIPYYSGKLPTKELEQTVYVSGTEIRKLASEEIKASPLWRAGAIYQSYNSFPTSFQTVDIAALSADKHRVYLAQKPGEDKLRFIGGFVDPTDVSLEHAAGREFTEETGGATVNNLKYLGSFRVDDWRYRSERDKIMTALFMGIHSSGMLVPSDDISLLKSVDLSLFVSTGWIEENITPEHHALALALATEFQNEQKTKKK
jgi:bifunctional NMN adenylyltransferase/nudix hydrolase